MNVAIVCKIHDRASNAIAGICKLGTLAKGTDLGFGAFAGIGIGWLNIIGFGGGKLGGIVNRGASSRTWFGS